ncbi:hypothetical protein K466DRAFT_45226 [Polyporus arcularius HHB13444]|uniref:Uncharacterized protein n=1 Tax=Polyporus arcularius HHB13444 TaxID=1314778 RepID=A0A5C3PJF2_9APHY|nr:hypothetical protein K466DRAFT_45226 [Polyporus arcularius HHB13444]
MPFRLWRSTETVNGPSCSKRPTSTLFMYPFHIIYAKSRRTTRLPPHLRRQNHVVPSRGAVRYDEVNSVRPTTIIDDTILQVAHARISPHLCVVESQHTHPRPSPLSALAIRGYDHQQTSLVLRVILHRGAPIGVAARLWPHYVHTSAGRSYRSFDSPE